MAQIIAGVDTHKDTHYAAVISLHGEHLSAVQFPATKAGYQALTAFITCQGELLRVGIEGTNSYGAGLTRHLQARNIEVVEVIRPAKVVRRMKGKSDAIDAYTAAHTALTHQDLVTPKTSIGTVEAIRVIHAGRRSVRVPFQPTQLPHEGLAVLPTTRISSCRLSRPLHKRGRYPPKAEGCPHPATGAPSTTVHTRRNIARKTLANPTGRIITAVTWIANSLILRNLIVTARTSATSAARIAEADPALRSFPWSVSCNARIYTGKDSKRSVGGR